MKCHITRGALLVHAIQLKTFNHYDMNVLRHAKFSKRFISRPTEVFSTYNGVDIYHTSMQNALRDVEWVPGLFVFPLFYGKM